MERRRLRRRRYRGWLEAGDDLEERSRAKRTALDSADLVLLVVDVTPAWWTRTPTRPGGHCARPSVLLVVNKVDDTLHEASSWEFLSLGAGDPHCISALHGRGAGDLLDEIVTRLATSRAKT